MADQREVEIDLTKEDEKILDRIWKEIRKES